MRHRWEPLGKVARCKTCGTFRTYQGRGSSRQAVYRARIGAPWLIISPACADPRQATIEDKAHENEARASEPIRPKSSKGSPALLRNTVTLRPVKDSRTVDARRSEWERTLLKESAQDVIDCPPGEYVALTMSRFGRVFGEERDYRLRTGMPIGMCTIMRAHSSWPGMLDAVMHWMRGTHHKSGTFIQLEVDKRPIARWTLTTRWTMEVLNAP